MQFSPNSLAIKCSTDERCQHCVTVLEDLGSRYVEMPKFIDPVLNADGHFPTYLEMKGTPTLQWGIPLTDKEQVHKCAKCPYHFYLAEGTLKHHVGTTHRLKEAKAEEAKKTRASSRQRGVSKNAPHKKQRVERVEILSAEVVGPSDQVEEASEEEEDCDDDELEEDVNDDQEAAMAQDAFLAHWMAFGRNTRSVRRAEK